ncbi:hypothetical protein [Umezawaea sp. NPDC059074]|uniref:hypothetical protein n=1 Tax=Umezawaea sp. NPDC059074 TaxID=3346716 RepID=UPI0036B072BB
MRARAVTDGITDPRWRTRALAELAVTAASRGDHAAASRFAEEAEAVCSTIAFTARKAMALTEIVTAVAVTGGLTRAEALARSIAVPHWRARATAELVSIVAGDARKARVLADTICEPDLRARAQVAIAARSTASEARALITSTLRTGEWIATLDVLARIEPAVVLAIGNDFLCTPRD